MSTEYVLDGTRISSLEEFYDEFGNEVSAQIRMGSNLDALNDILRGGFGTPIDGFTIRWSNSKLSQSRLGYPETVRQLERWLASCHPTNRKLVQSHLDRARSGIGPTVFDWIVEIIREHGPGGKQAESNVHLILT
jgi:RNAse (barnase) inhibitor barstar